MKISASLSILAALSSVPSSDAAVTTRMDIGFDGSLSGSAYTLGANELLNSGSFSSNGTPTISGGTAKLDGSAENDINADGFKYITGISLTTTSFFVEVRFKMDSITTPTNTTDNLVSIGSANDLRYVNGNFQFGYNVNTASSINLSAVAPVVGQYRDFGVVWDATAKQFSVWEGVNLLGSSNSGSPYNSYGPPDNINFGWFDLNAFTGRGANSTFDRVALSTYTGAFSPTSFLFVPEASTTILCLSSLGLLFLRKRNSHSKA
jgi:hypothetical protein